MSNNFYDRKQILKMVEDREITPEEGFELLKGLKERNSLKATFIQDADIQSYLNETASATEEKVGSFEYTDARPCSPGIVKDSNINNEIAIIGASGRFPGANNLKEFWFNISSGKDCITEVPKERWDIDEYYDPNPKNLRKTYARWGGFLKNIDMFDPTFFNISGKEAELSDPQQRLFLEEAWNALEDAGYATSRISNKKCGVFVGVGGGGEYLQRMNEEGLEKEAQAFWGNESSILPARISYFLNLKGPSVAINTACSSSLVAIHLACQNILCGESELAIAGGVYISSSPDFYIISSNANMLSPDGKCKTFDNGANGFVPGEGVGAIVLKPLEKALRDGDHVYAVIRGSGINQDGRTNGITAPSTISQTDLEAEVYKKYNIHPDTISYIETHGTGTRLGDPIEIEALTNAFRKFTDRKQFCAVGSVKTNIGHAATAAGIAGVLKVILTMKHEVLPPLLNFEFPNAHINFDETPFYVNTEPERWGTKPGIPRRAAVSSFGFSGTNCHLVLEEYKDNK